MRMNLGVREGGGAVTAGTQFRSQSSLCATLGAKIGEVTVNCGLPLLVSVLPPLRHTAHTMLLLSEVQTAGALNHLKL
jgi:hypothetical protein